MIFRCEALTVFHMTLRCSKNISIYINELLTCHSCGAIELPLLKTNIRYLNMRYVLALAFLLTSSAGMNFSFDQAEAASISNPKCRVGLRKAQSQRGYQAFAMTSGGAHCGWTTQSSSTQALANRAAMNYCKSNARGAKCRVVWPN